MDAQNLMGLSLEDSRLQGVTPATFILSKEEGYYFVNCHKNKLITLKCLFVML